MRTVFAALLLAAFGSFAETARAEYLWCSIMQEGSVNCGFTTLDQCRATVSGVGGFCMPQAPVGHRQPTRASIEAARKAGAGTR
jgi:Protein of unknown function (DUF3551)